MYTLSFEKRFRDKYNEFYIDNEKYYQNPGFRIGALLSCYEHLLFSARLLNQNPNGDLWKVQYNIVTEFRPFLIRTIFSTYWDDYGSTLCELFEIDPSRFSKPICYICANRQIGKTELNVLIARSVIEAVYLPNGAPYTIAMMSHRTDHAEFVMGELKTMLFASKYFLEHFRVITNTADKLVVTRKDVNGWGIITVICGSTATVSILSHTYTLLHYFKHTWLAFIDKLVNMIPMGSIRKCPGKYISR